MGVFPHCLKDNLVPTDQSCVSLYSVKSVDDAFLLYGKKYKILNIFLLHQN